MKNPCYLFGMPCVFLTAFLRITRSTLLYLPRHCTNIVGILPLLLAGSFVAVSRAAVPVTDGLSVIHQKLPGLS